MQATLERVVPPKRTGPKNTPVRLSDDAIRWARIASGYTGESMADYVSRITEERARADADALHAKLSAPPPAPDAPPRPKKGGE